jgi:non-lysosomal glucosylceramidase
MNLHPFNKSDAHSQTPTCYTLRRRDFVRLMGMGSLALAASGRTGWAQAASAGDLASLVPPDKNLDPAWLKSLFERGTPEVYTGDDLNYIGMPIGGICTGQLYLGGDGKLWQWDIFNIIVSSGCSGDRYQHPPKPEAARPVDQGFALAVSSNGTDKTYLLDKTGFPEIHFRGEYPIAKIDYAGGDIPVAVSLEAFSPYLPLNADESGIPATYFHYKVKNVSNSPVEATLTGWLQNAVCLRADTTNLRRNKIVPETGMTFLECSIGKPIANKAMRPDATFEDWHSPTYENGWTTEGTAFGSGPVLRSSLPSYIGDVGGETTRVVNSHASAPGNEIGAKDGQVGKLTSRSFTIDRDYLLLWIGGGNHPGGTCVNVVVDGKTVRSATGRDSHPLFKQALDLKQWAGQTAKIEIVDSETGGWGNVGVGKITLTDNPNEEKMEERPDYGTMGLALFGAPAETAFETVDKATLAGKPAAATNTSDFPIGAVGRKMTIAPGQTAEAVFALTWNFPNLKLDGLPNKGRYYATKYDSAAAVARFLGANWTRLSTTTRLWRDTWYDSTLPYWFLDRTFIPLATLATSTPYRFSDGRFYSWEGVNSCQGTCTHVWHYAQGMAHIFPELERDTRERVDLNIALDRNSGVSGFRAEFDHSLAVDGQSGTIIRFYREHRMAPDSTFLKKNWETMKLMFKPLMALDADEDGIMEGAQMNTLDQPWFGKNSWQSSLYVAALRAGAAMAEEMDDKDFADHCTKIADQGFINIPKQLFDGEYFSDKVNPAHLDSINSGSGCEIDQVFGQSWAFQAGLPRILPEKETVSALKALWKYNFAPAVGPYRAVHKPGRWYAQDGEAGLLMCTFPRSDWDYSKAKGGKNADWAAGYFNECMTGFEYQVAGHMVAEGLVQEGLAITRAIHDRYHASKRNPWNEIECGDHYSRAMAGYGVFINACGFEHHGPKGHLAFAPKITPEDFRAPFTTCEGWGTFSQKITGKQQTAEVHLKWGQLKLNTFALARPANSAASALRISLDGIPIHATMDHPADNGRLTITLPADFVIHKNQKLTVQIA